MQVSGAFDSQPIGIPRALFYFLHPSLWETFFQVFGIPVVVSEQTHHGTVERAGLISETEHCLPVKLLDAHLEALADKVGRVFVPRILSMRRGMIACPKLGALPDAVQAQFGGRIEVLTAEVDANRWPLETTLERLGRRMGAPAPVVARAIPAALAAARAAEPLPEPTIPGAPELRFLLIGHPYNLHDDFFSGPVLRILGRLGAAVDRIRFDRDTAPQGPLHWETSSVLYDSLRELDTGRYAGVVQLSSFNCGCDSISGPLFRDAARERRIPLLVLVLDEHSALAGLETRLEAFVDSVGGWT